MTRFFDFDTSSKTCNICNPGFAEAELEHLVHVKFSA